MMETSAPKQADGTTPPRTRTYYDLEAGRSYTLDLDDPLVACATSDLKRGWGDPFAGAAAMGKQLGHERPQNPGHATVAGIDTEIFVVSTSQGLSKLWIDPKSTLLMKWEVVSPAGEPITMLEVTKFDTHAPPAARLAIPTGCTKPTETGRKDQTLHLTAAPPGGEGGVTDALAPPASPKPCTALFRAVRLGSMAPLGQGYQIAIDRTLDDAHPASYRVGLTATGQAIFAGGGLTEDTEAIKDGILRIEDMPPKIHVELCFGKGGCNSAVIYRHCTAPESILVFAVHNPAALSDGGDWYWINAPAKSPQ